MAERADPVGSIRVHVSGLEVVMLTLDKERAIRKLLGVDERNMAIQNYYGGIDSIGIVLRDVVPRLAESTHAIFCTDGSGAISDADTCLEPLRAKIICKYRDLAAMPAACCDSLLRKEGILL